MYIIRTGRRFTLFVTVLLLSIYACVIWFNQDSVYRIPKKLQKYLTYEGLPDRAELEVNALKLKIKEINMKREVRNWEKFDPVVRETTIIAVQVYRGIRDLQYLIISLAQVRYIEAILLIFSHSYYSENINRLVHSIDFCKVMQIFYPHSVQLHLNKFPGIDTECINGSQPLMHRCQSRDARLAERKHHWWWKANYIFDQLEWSRGYTGTVIFLEEDQYVAPDLLHMLQYLHRSLSYFPNIEIMSLGSIYTDNLDPQVLTLEYWRPPYDVGIAFNKTTWRKIVELSSFYCMYDDISWSYSLLNVFKNFPENDINMVASIAPRVISTKQFDDTNLAALKISRIFSSKRLFPEKVNAIFLFGSNGRVNFNVRASPKGNGGWTNINDHLLCLDPLTVDTEDYEGNSRFDEYTG